MYMCIYLWKCQWCHIQTLSSHNHTEPFLSINFRYPVNDLVQCVEKKRWYEVRKKKKGHVKLLLYTSHSMILGRVAAFSYSDCSKSKIFRRRRKKSYEQWITSSENTKNKYKNNRTPSCTGTSCEHGEIYWYKYTFMWKTGIPITHDQMTTLHWLMIPLAN